MHGHYARDCNNGCKDESRIVSHNNALSNRTNEIAQQVQFEVYRATDEKLDVLHADSAILLYIRDRELKGESGAAAPHMWAVLSD